MAMNISTQIVSKLGSTESKIPLAVKDIFNSAGYTYFSYDAGGEVEGKDRFVDEAGTGLIWLFGIPAYKKLIDKTLYKKAGISPEVDVRILKDNDYFQQALKNAPNETILQELKDSGKNIKLTKSINIIKFALSLGLTIASYFALTKFKQNMTKKNIEKEFLKNKTLAQTSTQSQRHNNNSIFSEFETIQSGNKSTSFGASGSLTKTAETIMLNPINNMMIMDCFISGERLATARTKGEFEEYSIKEGSFLFFVYFADKIIKKGIDKASEVFLKAPVKLDAKFLTSDLAEKILNQENLQQDINEFSKQLTSNSNNNELYEFIFNNQDNIVIQTAKQIGTISTIKDSNKNLKIDTRKYIDLKKLKELTEDLKTFIEYGKNSKDFTKYLNKLKALKVGSTLLNVAICCFALGYMVPKFIYSHRKKNQDGKNDFHVKTEYEKELTNKYKNITA